jgi:hypothetical protein
VPEDKVVPDDKAAPEDKAASEDELTALRAQARDDRKLFARAAQVLGEIDRASGLSDEQADVLTALRIRVEGKKRASLEELLTVTGDIAGKKDLGDVLSGAEEKQASEWPVVEEKKKDWPGL